MVDETLNSTSEALLWLREQLEGGNTVSLQEIEDQAVVFKDSPIGRGLFLNAFLETNVVRNRHYIEQTDAYLSQVVADVEHGVLDSIEELVDAITNRPKHIPLVNTETEDSITRELQTVVIDNAKDATTDSLTGAPNRREYDRIIRKELENAYRTQSPLSIIAVDLDNFKKYQDKNPSHHEFGDRILVAVSTAMQAGIRKTDYCCRFGGDEFNIVCPNTDKEIAIVLAERVLDKIKVLGIPHPDEPGSYLTASLGIATYKADVPEVEPSGSIHQPLVADEFFSRLIKALHDVADKSLYSVKENGRNQVGYQGSPQEADRLVA